MWPGSQHTIPLTTVRRLVTGNKSHCSLFQHHALMSFCTELDVTLQTWPSAGLAIFPLLRWPCILWNAHSLCSETQVQVRPLWTSVSLSLQDRSLAVDFICFCPWSVLSAHFILFSVWHWVTHVTHMLLPGMRESISPTMLKDIFKKLPPHFVCLLLMYMVCL